MAETPENTDNIAQRGINLVLVAVVGVAFIGFFVGLDYGVPQHDIDVPRTAVLVESTADDTVVPAMSYAQVREWRNELRDQNTAVLEYLLDADPDLFAEFTPDPQDKRASLALRSERRAYNGAPPVIPHAVEQLGSDTCLACHGAGFKLESRTAKQLPHPFLENCMQCHAPTPLGIFDEAMLAENTFVGVAAPFEGPRAWLGAPPTVPHTTWMRDNCLACHGPTGWLGMETTHPWRQNCMQCHAPSAVLDLNPPPLITSEFLPPPEVSGE